MRRFGESPFFSKRQNDSCTVINGNSILIRSRFVECVDLLEECWHENESGVCPQHLYTFCIVPIKICFLFNQHPRELISARKTSYQLNKDPSFQRLYLWWSLCTLCLHVCQVRVTVGNSDLCCCAYMTSVER